MDNNNMKEQCEDYPALQIQDKLQQCLDYEAKYGECMTVTSWKKWCNSYEFRKREWEWRQNIVKTIKYGV